MKLYRLDPSETMQPLYELEDGRQMFEAYFYEVDCVAVPWCDEHDDWMDDVDGQWFCHGRWGDSDCHKQDPPKVWLLEG